MAKASYASLKLKVNTDITSFTFDDTQIEVLKYLPIEDKYDLVMITLQKAKEDGIYNPIKLEMFFHLHLVYMYTNLSFTEKQKENESKIYDSLKSNGFFDKFLEVIDEDEYNFLFDMVNELVNTHMNYKNSAGGILQSFVQDLPANAQAAAEIVKSFDPEKYQAVVDFATAANGGRPIKGAHRNLSLVDDGK